MHWLSRAPKTTLLLITTALYLFPSSESSVISQFCNSDNLANKQKAFPGFPIELGYVYTCCSEMTHYNQENCFYSTDAIIPFVLFNLEYLLDKLETSRVAPTIFKSTTYNAKAVAKKLYKSMDGWGTDEDTLIKVMTSMNGEQRKRTAYTYSKQHKRRLRDDIRDDTSGQFKNLLIALINLPEEHDAWLVRDAIAPVGTKEAVLLDVLATSSVSEILHVREAYQRFYDSSMEKDLEKELSGDGPVKDFLLFLSTRLSNDVSDEFVEKILSGNEVASKHDKAHLAQIMRVLYVSGDKGRYYYFTDRIRSTMAGLGTEDTELIGLITSRTERDLKAIQDHYISVHGRSLASDLKSDLSGDYLKLMLNLL